MDEYIKHDFLKNNVVSRRDYQEKIFVSCIGKNSLVVLPTSMGKTIIALMLSIYHLSNDIDKKIIFLAPTKPLVIQHYNSFKNMTIFGEEEWKLPILTGSIKPSDRHKKFLDAKIAFMTPQVLQNDLIANRIALSEVSLIIFDEAHRAVGDYAYTFIARYYLQKNPGGQILAMTASPGGDKDKITDVCKNLFIDNIEIRSAESNDVKPYVQNVNSKWIQIDLPDEYLQPKKKLEDLLKKFSKELKNNNLLESYNLNKITRKNLLASSKEIDKEIKKNRNDDSVFNLFAMKKVVSNAIRVSHMLELLEAQGIIPLNEFLKKSAEEARDSKSSKSLKELFLTNEIREVRTSVEKLVESNFIHPKLEKLGKILNAQFVNNSESRILIFANFRDTINSILDFIEQFDLIRATHFIGQAAKKKGKKTIKGMTQKEQVAVLNDFRSGKYNILVATSVAEEGLDIAECDLVIFYDVVPSEIRTIQRRGRTGRKSAGAVIILMTKGTREEGYFWAAKRREKNMKISLNELKKDSKKIKQKISNEIYLHHNDEKSEKKSSKNIDLFEYMNSVEKKEKKPKIKMDISKTEYLDKETKSENHDFSILVDNRETQSPVVRNLATLGANIILKNLPVADYIISDIVGIERKESVDFNMSIVDGRLFDELIRLSQNFEIPILIIEGNPIGVTGISKNAILGALASIIINMKITVLYSDSAQETSDLIYAFTKKVQKKKESIGKIYKKKTDSISKAQEQVIGSIPGINIVRAQDLLSNFSNVKNIFNADDEELKKVQGIGPSTVNRIKKVAESDYNKK